MSVVVESPRGTCVLGGISSVLSAVDKVCPIFHSGPGCCMQTTAGEAGQSGGKQPHFLSGVSLPSSNMLEREVVFGGVDKLRSTIEGAVEMISKVSPRNSTRRDSGYIRLRRRALQVTVI